MPSFPDQPDEYPNPVVTTAVSALTGFGDQLDRDSAAALLSLWRHNRELTDRERTAILSHFPEAGARP